MTFKDAIGVLVSAADARRGQWASLVNARENSLPDWSPDDTISELWEVWGSMSEDSDDTEAQDIANEITEAIRVVRKIYD